MKKGDKLSVDDSPSIANTGFTIAAKFNATSPSGVLVAQGGSALGCVLFLDGGHLTFALRRQKELTRISTTQTITGAHMVVAHLKADGTLTLALDGQPPATLNAGGPIKSMPADGLSVGSDEGGLVGAYTDTNPFTGTIDSLTIDLDP